jgi:Ser/Thr protein kinase RdoA (MazF antagonist)
MSSALTDEKLLAALQAWPLAERLAIRRLPGGMTSDVWQIEAGDQRFVAKYTYTKRAAFEGGLRAAELVERHGIACGRPLPTKQGALSIMIEDEQGQSRPLALLHYVPGERLDFSHPDAATLYGSLLGRTHSILLAEAGGLCAFDLYDFLLEEDPAVTAQLRLRTLIDKTMEAVRAYEARRPITSGTIWADALEIRLDSETGRAGIIDWGAIERGPILFDVALHESWYFPEGSQAYQKFIHAYLYEAPISAGELEGINYYKALLWARQARFFAYCVAENVALGGSTPISNAENLAKSRQELEYWLAQL